MSDRSFPRLLGDIGGTNARFAWQAREGAPLTVHANYACAAHPGLLEAICQFLADHRLERPAACAIGIANPVTGDEIRMTNHAWSFRVSALKRELGVERVHVLNDFTALAMSLPALTPDELLQIGPGRPAPGAPRAVIGPGTGLGVSGLIDTARGEQVAIAGEGGHVTMAAADDHEAAILARLRWRFGHVSAERVVSGPGLVNLYRSIAEEAGSRPHETFGAADILECCDDDPLCHQAMLMFCGFLGSAAGNLALTLGARGGVYIGGGIVPRIAGRLPHSPFRQRFEGKGRFRDYLAEVPTWVIRSDLSPALLGASRSLDHLQ